MKKTNPPYPFVVAEKEEKEEEINPQPKETWHGKILTLKDSI
jgi:hypothetical protein